jgi:hypothetical protein
VTPRGEVGPSGELLTPTGEVIPQGVKTLCSPLRSSKERACSALGVKEGGSVLS